MRKVDLKSLDLKEIREQLLHARADLLDLRLKKRLGSAEKPHRISTVRRQIARLETWARIKQYL